MSIASPRGLRACAILCASVAFPGAAWAQLSGEVPPPQRASIDENGVNVATGTYRNPHTDLVIGSGPGALSATRIYGDPPYLDAFVDVSSTYSPITINTGSATYKFTQSSNGWVTQGGDGATLVSSGQGYADSTSSMGMFYTNYSYNSYVMTLADGTAYTYDFLVKSRNGSPRSVYLSSIQSPSGLRTTLNWETRDGCNPGNPNPGGACTTNNNVGLLRLGRLDSVSTNAGYQINYTYQLQNFDANQTNAVQNTEAVQWQTLAGASGSNAQGGSGTLPSVTYAQNTTFPSGSSYNQTNDVTDATGRTTRYTKQLGGGSYEAVRLPGSTSDDLRVNMTDAGIVTSVVRGGQTWTYSYAASGNSSTLTVTDPTNWTRHYTSNLSVGLPTSIVDQFGRTTSYTYDANNRLATGTSPGGQVTTYTYDGNSNVTNTVVTPAGGGATISTSATYPPNCTGSLSCNLPTTTTDARNNVTSYSYDPTTFVPTSVTLPAVNNVQPQTRYGYAQVGGVQVLVSTSTCRTQSSCAGTVDEVKTTTSYNANLLPVSVTRGAGDGSLSATTAATYSAAGDVLTIDGPLPGTADTTRTYYDAMRRPLGTVSADPDGGGPLPSRAVRSNYDAQGRVASQDYGIATGQGDTDLANMTVRQTVAATFDAVGHVTSSTLSSGGTAYARTEASYDAAGRVLCQTVRMNPSAFTAGTDPCTLGPAGSYGPDRITRTSYGTTSPTMSVTSAYGLAEASTESVGYTLTGKAATVTDANGNVTAFAYDGFDRPWRTCYQTSSAAACAGSPGDYQQVTPDANGNAITVRQRDGQTIGATYDALNRLVGKDVPNTVSWETDKGYVYDLLGHLVQAADSYGRVLGFSYDALGRKVGQSDNWYAFGNAAYQYDAAGRRTRMTWNDGFWVGYAYLTTGETSAINDSGGNALATFGYDDLGRRTSLSRANGTVTRFTFDTVSRLTGLAHDLAGTAQDLSLTFAYNPAGQIASRTSSNDAYAFTQGYNVDRTYGVNGLNQLTSAGSTALGYDGRGNLTSSGASSYGYTSENRMASAPSSGLAYDPLDRLFNFQEGGVNTTVTYDGADAIAEVDQNNGALLRRYVQGPGTDAPLVWYEGPGTSDRRWLHADERGSVVAVTNDAGTAIAINAYDEYGIPGSGNIGRFQYTGQKWLPSVGMYDYKARMYSPTLGRFMQTDPIGYGDGLGWYNYVGGDPVNFSDPSGLQAGSGTAPSSGFDPANDIIVNGRHFCPPPNTVWDPVAKQCMLPENALTPYISPAILLTLSAQMMQTAYTPQMQQVSCVQDNKAYHDQQVAAEARNFQANGYNVVFNVYFRVATPGPDGILRVGAPAIADFVAFKPGSRVIFEMKTGGGDFSDNQRMVYPLNGPTVAVPVGRNAAAAGYEIGKPIIIVPNQLTVKRCPR